MTLISWPGRTWDLGCGSCDTMVRAALPTCVPAASTILKPLGSCFAWSTVMPTVKSGASTVLGPVSRKKANHTPAPMSASTTRAMSSHSHHLDGGGGGGGGTGTFEVVIGPSA